MADPKESNDLPVSNTPLFAANEKIAKINVADEIKNSFLDYSMSVIISRALPDVRDGLKPSQRRILYAMHELSLFPGRKHYKCAKICGDTSGNYHPHGEAVIYPTLVHMAQPWAMREKLVDGKGNFGYNAASGEFGDMMEFGILDPTKVTRTALQNAASVASLMITTECMIADAPKKEEHAHAGGGMPGGMGGMGGMEGMM